MATCDLCGEMGVRTCYYCDCCIECCPEFEDADDSWYDEDYYEEEELGGEA